MCQYDQTKKERVLPKRNVFSGFQLLKFERVSKGFQDLIIFCQWFPAQPHNIRALRMSRENHRQTKTRLLLLPSHAPNSLIGGLFAKQILEVALCLGIMLRFLKPSSFPLYNCLWEEMDLCMRNKKGSVFMAFYQVIHCQTNNFTFLFYKQ